MTRHRRFTNPGRRLGTLVAIGALLAPTAALADTPPQRLIDVVQITWPGAPSAQVTADDAAEAIQSDTIARWRTISNGAIEFTFDAVLPAITMDRAMPCGSAGVVQYMSDTALAAYQRAGITNWDHRFLVVVAPDPGGCVWDGRGVVNQPPSTSGILLLKDTADSFVIAHELGHNLGLGHSNLETCSGGKPDGAWADCQAIEYGSATDVMSNLDRTSPLAEYHQWRLGLLPDTSVALADRSQTVVLQPVDAVTGTRALFIRDQSAAYWVEYRRADPANHIDEGLVIYRTDPPPASSVVDPAGNGGNSDSSTDPTTDVWMLSLDSYSFENVDGSPSLRPGVSFTTAFGGVTLTPSLVATGASVSVVRKTAPAPAAPAWTPRSSWRGRDSQLTRADIDNGGLAIDHYDARISTDTGTIMLRVPSTAVERAARTYLAPVGPGSAVMATWLPEGVYDLELRAVNVAGVAGPWSVAAHLAIDGTAPTVTPRFTVLAGNSGGLATLGWSGARDVGAGLCSVRGFNEQGFALMRWTSDTAGNPRFRLPASGSDQYVTSVQDCFGNATRGTLALTTDWRSASVLARSGSWSSGSRCTGATCTATFRTGTGSSAIIVGAGSGTVWVDGRRFATLSNATRNAPRVAARVDGPHRVQVQTSNLTLFGVQGVRGAWTPLPAVTPTSPGTDPTLADDVQLQLSRIGFSQEDFADGMQVAALQGGTDVDQPTLDFCNGSFPSEADRRERRQVLVTRRSDDPYSFVSSETVRYWSPDSVRAALAELDAAAAVCRSRGYAVAADGSHEAYRFLDLPPLPVGLRPAADRRIFLVTIGSGEQARTLLIAYQFRGRTLNAMYVVKQGTDTLDVATVSDWLRVAAVLAGRLTSDQ